ncbi:MAG: peptidylprolyl isomerase [Saprospiraceae bacterium]
MKLFIIMSSIAAFLMPVILSGQGKSVDKIIAKVGSEIVLYSDWQEQISYIKEKQSFLQESEACSVLENILIQKFMVHQAKLDSVEVNDDEIESQLNSRIEQILQYMGNDSKKFEEYYGQTVAEVRNRFRDDLKSQLLTEKLQNKIVGKIVVTPKETEHFFNLIPKDSIPYFNSEVEIAEIVIKPKANEIEINKAKDKLSKIIGRIRAGEDFSKLASLYSDDLSSAKEGGNLGWIKRGNLVPEYEAVAYNLEQDSMSGIVESEFGYHLIQLIGRRGNNINTRHILIKPNITQKDYDETKSKLEEIKKQIIKDSFPFEAMVRKYSDKNAETYNSGGQIVNPKTGNSYFEIADLEPDVYFAIDNLKVGEISAVIEAKERDGSKSFKIFKLISRSTPHKANLLQDYAKIQQAAKEQKKSEIFRNWLSIHVPKIYSEIDLEVAQNCPNLELWNKKSNKG